MEEQHYEANIPADDDRDEEGLGSPHGRCRGNESARGEGHKQEMSSLEENTIKSSPNFRRSRHRPAASARKSK